MQTENKQRSEDLYLPASQDYLQPYQCNISLHLLSQKDSTCPLDKQGKI